MSGQLDFIYDSEIFIDLYGILEIEMDTKTDEIKNAYIKMAKKHHPDHGGSSDKFQEITRAYDILYNKETRKEYDLYYLKKSMDEFKGDDIIRLRDDFKNFMTSTDKQITKEELDKLYADTFDEYREQYKDTAINDDDLKNKINDIKIERNNMEIETSDDTISNFISQHKDLVNVNDFFEFIKYKNSQSFSNSIVNRGLGTLDTMPGYSNGFSSFMDDNEYFGSNLYSNINDMNSTAFVETTNNLNIDDYMQWKTTKPTDTKLNNNDIDNYLKQRQLEQENIFKEVESNLSSVAKVKEVEKFLKTKHINENINEYYNNLDNLSDKKSLLRKFEHSKIPEIINLDSNNELQDFDEENTYKNSSDIDGMLKFMEQINSSNTFNYDELEKEIGINKKDNENFIELKANLNLPKVNNVRKNKSIL